MNAAKAEGLDQCLAVVERIVRIEVGVAGDECAEVVAERDVDRRTVVDGAYAHGDEMLREPRGLVAETRREIGMDVVRADLRAAGARDAAEIRGLVLLRRA